MLKQKISYLISLKHLIVLRALYKNRSSFASLHENFDVDVSSEAAVRVSPAPPCPLQLCVKALVEIDTPLQNTYHSHAPVQKPSAPKHNSVAGK